MSVGKQRHMETNLFILKQTWENSDFINRNGEKMAEDVKTVAFMSLLLRLHPGESMLVVDEGSSACLCGGVLGALDPDNPPDQLTFHLEIPPLHGFLENMLPSPGSEKSNAGVRVG